MHGIFKQFSVLVKQAEIDAPSIYAETFLYYKGAILKALLNFVEQP